VRAAQPLVPAGCVIDVQVLGGSQDLSLRMPHRAALYVC